jgi:hypothetical protein
MTAAAVASTMLLVSATIVPHTKTYLVSFMRSIASASCSLVRVPCVDGRPPLGQKTERMEMNATVMQRAASHAQMRASPVRFHPDLRSGTALVVATLVYAVYAYAWQAANAIGDKAQNAGRDVVRARRARVRVRAIATCARSECQLHADHSTVRRQLSSFGIALAVALEVMLRKK